MTQLPLWMTGEILEAWEEYVAQRKRDKLPMTPRSMRGRIARLEALKDAGHDPLQCLDEAINGHWRDFYAPKEKPIERVAGAVTQEADDFIRRQREAQAASQTPEAVEARRRAIQSIKRVA